jgi:hypothetical protein
MEPASFRIDIICSSIGLSASRRLVSTNRTIGPVDIPEAASLELVQPRANEKILGKNPRERCKSVILISGII